MPNPRRIKRLQQLILEVAAETLQREVRDPRIGLAAELHEHAGPIDLIHVLLARRAREESTTLVLVLLGNLPRHGLHGSSKTECGSAAVFPFVKGWHVDAYDTVGALRNGDRAPLHSRITVYDQVVLLHLVTAIAWNA